MSLFKCKMCGADLEINEGASIAECEYCGTKQTVPKAMDENLQNLFNRANTLRIKSEFDKAEKLYEKIIQSDSTQSEAYWGLILCKYGIEYVDDPVTFKKVPTCHRASYDSIIADDDYKSAIENADMSQRMIYEKQAKEIDRIQKEILALAQKEETYDIFICYKETDGSGSRTQDSVIANDIYYQLTNEGYKVFYAAITLEGKLGSAYEPIIFAALNSAKVMLAIGTKPEYFNAVWVKNEWSRYLKIIKNDRSKLLIPCYRDMDAYELPDEFAHLQAQDMAKIGFINDVVRGIQKVIAKDESKKVVEEPTSYTPAPANIAPLLKRVFMFLEDGEWSKADDFCEQVLNQDPENAQAYLGKLMAELRVKTQEELKNCAKPFDDRNNFKKVMRFGDDNLRNYLSSCIEFINNRNETARLNGIYNRATESMNTAKTEAAFKSAAELFDSIKAYKDSADLAKKCRENAEISRKDAILESAKECMQIYDYEEAIKKLETIKGFRESDELIVECYKQIDIIKAELEESRKKRIYNNAVNLMSQRTLMGYTDAIKEFASIPEFRDANELLIDCQNKMESLKIEAEARRVERERQAEIARIEKEKRQKRNKIIASIVISLLCIIVAAIFILYTVIQTNKYNHAMSLLDANKYNEAHIAFEALDGYKDSVMMITECKYRAAIALMEEGKYSEAISAFELLVGYKDSTAMVLECKYCNALELFDKKEYSQARVIFQSLGAYKDSVNKMEECNIGVLEEKYNEALTLMESGKYKEAIPLFKSIAHHKDSSIKASECQTAIFDIKYNEAIRSMNAGNIIDAYETLITLDGYKDSIEKADSIFEEYKNTKLHSAKIGDYIVLGKYEQDNNKNNGSENIEWLVLDEKEGKLLVISKYVLDCHEYDGGVYGYCYWKNSSLRDWLNNTFYESTFSANEKLMIYRTNIAQGIIDRIFALSAAEAQKYFAEDWQRRCSTTAYAKERDTYNRFSWWLRTMQEYAREAVSVNNTGAIDNETYKGFELGVRPAMWITIPK